MRIFHHLPQHLIIHPSLYDRQIRRIRPGLGEGVAERGVLVVGDVFGREVVGPGVRA